MRFHFKAYSLWNARDKNLIFLNFYNFIIIIIHVILTCKATFLAISGTWKPSCSRYFVSDMTSARTGSKFTMNDPTARAKIT